jgi:hypothetical protein
MYYWYKWKRALILGSPPPFIMTPAENICCARLPVYTPSAPSPDYSSQPAGDEQTLQQTPRNNRCLPTGTFVRKTRKVTVTLFEQENDAKIPTYGQGGLVSGTIYLEDHELISDVVLKVRSMLSSWRIWTNVCLDRGQARVNLHRGRR